ncbi:hypothetical protein CEP51_015724 [Fusarium floridanum]|uniref:Uncharacterized protein n=1 Tax=Fusarium floridanum TaxID=1325733 RepID=A0A428P455_9HYPO|nr:hypothetical protein CEP51_015724 [Fusarium floridanum]
MGIDSLTLRLAESPAPRFSEYPITSAKLGSRSEIEPVFVGSSEGDSRELIRTCPLRNLIKPTNAMEQRRHWIERCDACGVLVDSTCDGSEET